jgi:hypothetical protein
MNDAHDKKVSPFWYQLNKVFALNEESRIVQQPEVVRTLSKSAKFIAPKVDVISLSPNSSFVVMPFIEGVLWKADKFPIQPQIYTQLGETLGRIHSKSFSEYGNMRISSLLPGDTFLNSLLKSMYEVIDIYWEGRKDLHENLQKIKSKLPIANDFKFSLIMPDISANQFVYTHDLKEIKAIVDFDSYVIGPIELELCALEVCMEGNYYSSFKSSYEEFGELPEITEYRELFRYFIYLNELNENTDWNKYAKENIIFS